jgi:hypothetical protein
MSRPNDVAKQGRRTRARSLGMRRPDRRWDARQGYPRYTLGTRALSAHTTS